MNLSKVWGFWLMIVQLLNAAMGALTYLMAVPDSGFAWLAAWKAKAIVVHLGIAALVGMMQAFAKSLADTDGNGIPDIFEQQKP